LVPGYQAQIARMDDDDRQRFESLVAYLMG
jgi:hypothetical protein